MMKQMCALAAAASVLSAVPLAHGGHGDDDRFGVGSFRPVATFSVPGATSAEIVSATRDGKYLVYSDAIGRRFGLVDIRNPHRPQQLATLDAGGDPTSVAVLPVGNLAVGCVQPGKLILIDLTTFTQIGERAIGRARIRSPSRGSPGNWSRSSRSRTKGVWARVRRGRAPEPGGLRQLAERDRDPSRIPPCLTAAGLIAPDDPQPEFVSIRGTKVAVTLQENNGIAIIDISNPSAPVLDELFSAGVIADRPADLQDDARISFTDAIPSGKLMTVPDAGARVPDAIGWSDDGATLFTADEGEANFTGGRGWSAHAPTGAVLYDDGGELEATAVQFGQYPDGRSDAKGIEAESLAIDEVWSARVHVRRLRARRVRRGLPPRRRAPPVSCSSSRPARRLKAC